MSSTSVSVILALKVFEGTGTGAVELRAEAEAKLESGAYVAAAEAYLRLAGLDGVVRREELFNAHSSFEAAYLTTGEVGGLCRALAVAELVVREGDFRDEQMALFWRELVTSDIDRLKNDAKETKRANCRFSATGTVWAPVPLLAAEESSPATLTLAASDTRHVPMDMSYRTGGRTQPDEPTTTRRYRVHTAVGALSVGFGVGAVALFAGALAIEIDQVQALRQQYDLVRAEHRAPTAEEERWARERRSVAFEAQAVAIGTGIAGVAMLATGGALLGTRHRPARPVTLRPYGGAQGAGFILRGRF